MSEAMSGASAVEQVTETVRRNWGWFLALGIVFILGGALAIAMPEISTLATTLIVATMLGFCGVMQIIHAFQTRGWSGFLWNLATGIIQLVGGAVIYFNPFAGAVAITLVIAAVLMAQGVSQIALAFKVRPFDGWGWLLTAGIIAVLAGVLIAIQPFAALSLPGILVGLSLIFSGSAYVAISLAARRIVKKIAAA